MPSDHESVLFLRIKRRKGSWKVFQVQVFRTRADAREAITPRMRASKTFIYEIMRATWG